MGDVNPMKRPFLQFFRSCAVRPIPLRFFPSVKRFVCPQLIRRQSTDIFAEGREKSVAQRQRFITQL